MPENPSLKFHTQAVPLASYLKHLHRFGEPTLSLIDGSRVLFTFNDTEDLRREVAKFEMGQARVEPRAFETARTALRIAMSALKGPRPAVNT